jgi:hypothetical protein
VCFVTTGGAGFLARGKGWVAMAPRRRNSDEGREAEEHEREQPQRKRRERPRGQGRERQAFLDYLAKRWSGSPSPTAEAYTTAKKQWRQLPGAVITLPTDLGTLPGTAMTEGEGGNEP